MELTGLTQLSFENRVKAVTNKKYTQGNSTSHEWHYYVPRAGEVEHRIFNDRITGDLVEALGTYEELFAKMHPTEILNIARR